METLRSIAELVIWGDQHEPSIMDTFFESQMLVHFVKILTTRSNRVYNDLVKQASVKRSTPGCWLHSLAHTNCPANCAVPFPWGPQVLQTLSIMIQNTRSETSLYYMFSNNHVNNILTVAYDYEDEEASNPGGPASPPGHRPGFVPVCGLTSSRRCCRRIRGRSSRLTPNPSGLSGTRLLRQPAQDHLP